ncbi:F-box/WD repeat-containing protein 4 isoform X3 [Phocoena sinus]|uniref:F-box/WD repeat-containing protein 4 isoform X3 n=1 Tax=Phocoena sinus TaxID=42100 RepID=UPI0013C3F616|nr:F-box/WD repeat-containing protein 4 isoform X3 [Phocoena sinus]
MGSQGGLGAPGNGGPGEGESGETRKLQEGKAARGKRRKGKRKGKAGAGQGGRGSGAEGKTQPPQAKEAAGLGAEAGERAGLGKVGEGGGSVEEGARRIVRGDEGSAGARKEAKGRYDGKKEEWRVRTGQREEARPARAQGRGCQAWGRLAGTGAAMAAATEEEAGAREPAGRPAAGPALLRLPEELLLLICSYLDMQALGRLAQVCRWLRRFTNCDLLWRRIARASLNSGFTRLGTDLMASVPVKERVKVSQNWRLGRCREGILLKWKCSQMPWMQLEGDSLYISQANFILAYQFRPDGASLNRRPLGVFAGHDEDVCHFVLANSHIISAGGDGKIGIHKIHSTFTVKYSAHEQEVNCVDCKGGIIVSGSRDRTAKVWPLASGRLGQCLHTIQTEDRVWSIAISPLHSGQLMTHLGGDFPPGAGVLDVMYESPSTLLSCGYDTYVRYWDLRASVRRTGTTCWPLAPPTTVWCDCGTGAKGPAYTPSLSRRRPSAVLCTACASPPGISTLRCLTTSMAWTFKRHDRATPACGPEKPATQGPLLSAGCSDTSSPAPPVFLDL